MRRLDGQDMRNAYEVARRFNELAEEVDAKLDHLFERMDSIEGVMEHGHHEAPVLTIVGSLAPEREAADIDDEGDPGECPECGAPYQIVRPGKVQDTCRCEEVRQLTDEVVELRRRLAEKPVGVLAEIERRLASRAEVLTAVDELRKQVAEVQQECAAVMAHSGQLMAENERLRTDNARLACGYAERLGDHQENERLRADNAVVRGSNDRLWGTPVGEG